jgi:hypothetical protein
LCQQNAGWLYKRNRFQWKPTGQEMVSEYGMEETHTSNDHRPAWVPVMCQYFSALAKDLDPPLSWPDEDLAIESKAARCSTTPTWRKPRPWLQRANVEPCFLKHIYCRTVLEFTAKKS